MELNDDSKCNFGALAWFKFLIDENLLEEKLKNTPAAILISTFLHQAEVSHGISRDIRISENLFGENEVTENAENNRIRCLKILAAKVASFISWNLDYLQKQLPANHVYALLMFLVKLTTSNDSLQFLSSDMNVNLVSPVALFALNLLCCWSIQFVVEESLPLRPSKVHHVQIPGLIDPCVNLPAIKESILKMLLEKEGECVILLEKILTSQQTLADMPTRKCFSLKIAENIAGICDWSQCYRIQSAEITSQASFCLGSLFFLRRNYHSALSAFEFCQRSMLEVKEPTFMKIVPSKLDGYLRACRGVLKIPLIFSPFLSERIKKSFNNNYQEWSLILAKDLEKQELTLNTRFELEDKAIAEQLSKKNLYIDVLYSNTIRRVLEGRLMTQQFAKNFHNNGLVLIKKLCSDIYLKISDHQKILLKEFLLYISMMLLPSGSIKDTLLDVSLKGLFGADELPLLPTSYIPSFINRNSFIGLDSSGESTKIVNQEQKLLTCYDATKINEVLYSLVGIVGKYNLLFLSDKWHLPLELHSTLETISINNIHMSTLLNILVAKSKICQQLELFKQSRELLEFADTRLRETTFYKLTKLIKWEMLAVDFLSVFNAKGATLRENVELVERAKNCLSSIHHEPDLQPSHDFLRLSVLHLLNNEEWEFLIGISSSNEVVQLGHMVGGLCKELNQLKTARTLARNFIEFIALTFSTPSKRPLQGIITKDCLLNFVSLIKNEIILSVFISCLIKLLRFADQNLSGDIYSDYVVFWPSAITNTMLERNAILEAVFCVLDRAMIINNNNTSWIRTQADLYFVLKQYHLSLGYYLYLGLSSTCFFVEPVTKNIYDDQVYRRMIQACMQLNCFTQAIVLGQFLEEVDYTTSLKCITERSPLDSGGCYYDCIWDTTLMEFIINSHHRNAEIEKLCYTHHLMKMPEMNSNKKIEVLQEISNTKKMKFLRKMAVQYLGMN